MSSREEQDLFAYESNARALKAIRGRRVQGRNLTRTSPVEERGTHPALKPTKDPGKRIFKAWPRLKSAFKEGGAVTAANSSKISDGASALVLMSVEKAKAFGIKTHG